LFFGVSTSTRLVCNCAWPGCHSHRPLLTY